MALSVENTNFDLQVLYARNYIDFLSLKIVHINKTIGFFVTMRHNAYRDVSLHNNLKIEMCYTMI